MHLLMDITAPRVTPEDSIYSPFARLITRDGSVGSGERSGPSRFLSSSFFRFPWLSNTSKLNLNRVCALQ